MRLGQKMSEGQKRKISKANKGKNNPRWGKFHSEEIKKKISKALKGKYPSEESRKKMSEVHKGKNNPNWKGGITPLGISIRTSLKYREWKDFVFERDNYVCQYCGDSKGGNLNSHHIKRFSFILEEYNIKTIEEAEQCEKLWSINNGITLCKNCHIKIHRGNKK